MPRSLSFRPSRWKKAELAALKAVYEEGAVPVNQIAAECRTSRGQIMRLAAANGWARRGAPKLPAEAHAHWTLYRKVFRHAGRSVALEAVAAQAAESMGAHR